MKRLMFLLCVSFAAIVGAQTTQDWFWGKPIASVQWEGVVHADRRELDSVVKAYIGKPFTEELWMALQARVYELDWFETIEPAAFPGDDARTRVIVKFVVTEKPSLESIKISGNSGIKSPEILDVVKVKAGDIFNASFARIDELAIRRLYIEKGYPDARVSSSSAPGGIDGTVVLTFIVAEGAQVAVKEILFSGNAAVGAQSLKGLLDLKESGLFQSGAFQEALLESDKQKILDYYRSKGYVDAVVADVVRDYRKDEKSGRTYLHLTFVIAEGKAWLFGGVSFEGNKVFGTDKLLPLVRQKEGALLNYRKLLLDKQRVDDLYYESGYIFNSIALSEKRDEERGSIYYTIQIAERDRAHIESIVFKGNKKTKDHVLYRELPLQVGDIFSKTKIIEGLRNLYNLQYFSAIEPEMLPGSAENLMGLIINVEEQSTADMQFGITLSGFGETDSFPVSGNIKWNDKNFLGGGQTFGVDLIASPTDQSLTFSYLDKWLFGKRISGGADLSFAHKKQTTAQDILYPIFDDGVPDPYSSYEEYIAASSTAPDVYKMPYNTWDLTLGLSTGYVTPTPVGDLGFGVGFSTTLGTVEYEIDKYRPATKSIRDQNGIWSLTNKVSGRAYLNRLDLSYNPSKGFYGSQKMTLAGILDGESQHYVRSDSKIEAYATLFDIPLFEGWSWKWVLGGHSSFGLMLPKPGYSEAIVNTTDALRIDGTFVGRGWSKLYGHNGLTLWENWLELRMPVFPSFFWLDGFLDIAALRTSTGLLKLSGNTPAPDAGKPNFSNLGWENLAMSVGFGVRFTIPQFPFRFYFAKRFSYDGSTIDWKTDGATGGFDFVISMSQALN